MTKKRILVAALAVCVIAVLSMGSLAWFTDEDSVTNEFYVADSTEDPDEIFGVDVWETVDGEEIGRGDDEENGAKYDEILPGEMLNKEPVLENTGIHPMYVRAIVTVTGGDILKESMMGDWGDADKFLAGTPDTWTLQDILYTDAGELVYVYYYNTALAPDGVTEPIFTDVIIPTELTLDQAVALENFTVTVLGQAIQSEYLFGEEGPIATAQDAFAKYWDAEGTIAGYTAEEILANAMINDEAVTDVYYTINPDDPSEEVSLTNVTASVTDSVVKISDEVMNAAVIIDSCDFTVAEGGYVVYAEGNGGLVVYAHNVTVNGEVLNDSNYAEYFHNVLVFFS